MLDPYQKLFTTILKWQKAEKKSMDGVFQDLNAETTQAEVYTILTQGGKVQCNIFITGGRVW